MMRERGGAATVAYVADAEDEFVVAGGERLPAKMNLRGLVGFLVQPRDRPINDELLNAFLIVLPSVSSPLELLSVLEDCVMEAKRDAENTDAVNVVVKNVKSVLKEWLGHSAATVDFSVGNALQILEDFIDSLGGETEEDYKQLKRMAKHVRTRMVQHSTPAARTSVRLSQTSSSFRQERRQEELQQQLLDRLERRMQLQDVPEMPDEEARARLASLESVTLTTSRPSSVDDASADTTSLPIDLESNGSASAPKEDPLSLAMLSSSLPAQSSLRPPSHHYSHSVGGLTPSRHLSLQRGRPVSQPSSPGGMVANGRRHAEFAMSVTNPTEAVMALKYSATSSVITLIPYDVLAELLTVLDYEECLVPVRPREFINMAWTRKDTKHLHPDQQGARNIIKWITTTNQRVSWVAQEILRYGSDIGPASDAITYFLRVCRSCSRRNNFSAIFQIATALTLPAVSRLSSWKDMPDDKMELFKRFHRLISSNDNYAAYRAEMHAVQHLPHIPALQVMVRDVTHLEQREPWIEHGHINVDKVLGMANKINTFLVAQQHGFWVVIDPSTEEKTDEVSRQQSIDQTRNGTQSIHAERMLSRAAESKMQRYFSWSPGQANEMDGSDYYASPEQLRIQSLIFHVRQLSSVLNKVENTPVATYTLHSNLKLLQYLQGLIQNADGDLKKLWQDSKQVNEAEQHRLVDKLLHVGLL